MGLPFYQLSDRCRAQGAQSDVDERSTRDQLVLLPEPLPICVILCIFRKETRIIEFIWPSWTLHIYFFLFIAKMAVKWSNKKSFIQTFRHHSSRAIEREKYIGTKKNLTATAVICKQTPHNKSLLPFIYRQFSQEIFSRFFFLRWVNRKTHPLRLTSSLENCRLNLEKCFLSIKEKMWN